MSALLNRDHSISIQVIQCRLKQRATLNEHYKNVKPDDFGNQSKFNITSGLTLTLISQILPVLEKF